MYSEIILYKYMYLLSWKMLHRLHFNMSDPLCFKVVYILTFSMLNAQALIPAHGSRDSVFSHYLKNLLDQGYIFWFIKNGLPHG